MEHFDFKHFSLYIVDTNNDNPNHYKASDYQATLELLPSDKIAYILKGKIDDKAKLAYINIFSYENRYRSLKSKVMILDHKTNEDKLLEILAEIARDEFHDYLPCSVQIIEPPSPAKNKDGFKTQAYLEWELDDERYIDYSKTPCEEILNSLINEMIDSHKKLERIQALKLIGYNAISKISDKQVFDLMRIIDHANGDDDQSCYRGSFVCASKNTLDSYRNEIEAYILNGMFSSLNHETTRNDMSRMVYFKVLKTKLDLLKLNLGKS